MEGGSVLHRAFAVADAKREGPDAAAGYAEARAILQQALEEAPDRPDLLSAQAHLWADEVAFRSLIGEEREQHHSKAQATYERALELDPDNVRAHSGLGDLAMSQETEASYVEATGHFERAIAADPQDRHARQRLAEVLAHLGRDQEAEAVLAEAPAPPAAPPDPGKVAEPSVPNDLPPAHESTAFERPEITEDEAEQLEAWKALADREADNAAIQRAVAIQCRQQGDSDCADAYDERADALEDGTEPNE